jgi:hypothetical protein
MNPQEFKQLSSQVVGRVQAKLDEKGDGQKVFTFKNNPFDQNTTLYGIPLFKDSNVCEVYALFNDGNTAYWSFQGQQQFK